MKTYLSVLAIVAYAMIATPTLAAGGSTANMNVTFSKTTSNYAGSSFEEIGVVGSAADQDGLKLLTVQRYRATGELVTLGTSTCDRTKSCAVATSFIPASNDAGNSVTVLVTATDLLGNVTTASGRVTVGSIPVRDTTAPSISLTTNTNTSIVIPRDASSATISFKTQFSDASLINSVVLFKRYNGERNFAVASYLFDANYLSRNGRSCPTSSPCQIPTTFTVTNADVGRQITFMAEVSDMNANVRDSEYITFTITKEATADRTVPAGSITATPASFTLSNDETGTVSLRATLTDNIQLKDVRFYRTNPLTGTQETLSTLLTMTSAGVECNTGRNSCTVNFSTLIPGAFAGNSVAYYAIVHDQAGNETRTASANVRVTARTTTPSTTGVPTVTFSTSKTSMTASEFATLSATATSNGGVYAVEIRALPSWTETVTKRRCTITGAPRSGSCSLEIGPYTGRTSGTIKVWAIAWDNTSGLGGNSGERTITITR